MLGCARVFVSGGSQRGVVKAMWVFAGEEELESVSRNLAHGVGLKGSLTLGLGWT